MVCRPHHLNFLHYFVPGTLVLAGGAINPSFSASHKLTVLGGVISTSHGDNADFAGFFAANTNYSGPQIVDSRGAWYLLWSSPVRARGDLGSVDFPGGAVRE